MEENIKNIKKPIILMPTYEPDDKLITMIEDLKANGYDDILVVDDGNSDDKKTIFDKVAQFENVHILRHIVNVGKGRALKTGFNYALEHYPNRGVITCDGDGQHHISAINDVADAMAGHPKTIVLGKRLFRKGKNVPIANFLGNAITKVVFYILTGLVFGDTQCGLRGFSDSTIQTLMNTKGERFEFENNMLIDVRKKQVDYVEVEMEAIYINSNESSHFNKIVDSAKIYTDILSFLVLPILCGLLGLLLSYILVSSLFMCSILRPTLIYAASLLVSWLALSSVLKDSNKTILLMIAHTAVSSLIFLGLYILTLSYFTSMWLCAILVVPSFYYLYLRIRYGKSPKRIKYIK